MFGKNRKAGKGATSTSKTRRSTEAANEVGSASETRRSGASNRTSNK